MPSFRSLIDPCGRPLAYHLDRLRRTLAGYRERLREALAAALSQAVGDAVRDALTALLREPGPCRPADPYSPRPYHPPSASYGWRHGPDDEYDPDYIPLDGDDEDDYRRPPTPGPAPPAWALAVAVGLRTSAWWLQRRRGRRPLLVALGLGAAACAWALRGGRLTAAGLGLLTSALGLAALDGLAGAGADLLDRNK
jgi:hypothetical protein